MWVAIKEGRGLRDVGQEIKCGFCCAGYEGDREIRALLESSC